MGFPARALAEIDAQNSHCTVGLGAEKLRRVQRGILRDPRPPDKPHPAGALALKFGTCQARELPRQSTLLARAQNRTG